jgi:hypothetical protein
VTDILSRPEPEQSPAEQAAALALHLFLVGEGLIDADVPLDTYTTAAVDIAAAIEPHHHVAAYDEAVEALGHLASFSRLDHAPEGFVRGIAEARGLISRQADALNDHLAEPCTEEGK